MIVKYLFAFMVGMWVDMRILLVLHNPIIAALCSAFVCVALIVYFRTQRREGA